MPFIGYLLKLEQTRRHLRLRDPDQRHHRAIRHRDQRAWRTGHRRRFRRGDDRTRRRRRLVLVEQEIGRRGEAADRHLGG